MRTVSEFIDKMKKKKISIHFSKNHDISVHHITWRFVPEDISLASQTSVIVTLYFFDNLIYYLLFSFRNLLNSAIIKFQLGN